MKYGVSENWNAKYENEINGKWFQLNLNSWLINDIVYQVLRSNTLSGTPLDSVEPFATVVASSLNKTRI